MGEPDMKLAVPVPRVFVYSHAGIARVPVPVTASVTDVELVEATVSVPEKEPTAVGANVRFDTHVPLAANDAAQVDDWLNPAPDSVTVTPERAAAVERFATVTANVEVEPEAVAGNAYEVIATVPFLNCSMLLVPVTARVGVTAAAVPVEVVAAYAVTTPLAAADDVGV